MTPPNITPDDLARWKAVCEVARYPLQEGLAGPANIVSFDGDDIRPVALVWNASWREFILTCCTALPALIVAYEQVERERNAYKFAGEQAVGMGTNRAILDERDRLKMQVRELEAEVRTLRNLSVTLTEGRNALLEQITQTDTFLEKRIAALTATSPLAFAYIRTRLILHGHTQAFASDERNVCLKAGTFGHYGCGLCDVHQAPRGECGCVSIQVAP